MLTGIAKFFGFRPGEVPITRQDLHELKALILQKNLETKMEIAKVAHSQEVWQLQGWELINNLVNRLQEQNFAKMGLPEEAVRMRAIARPREPEQESSPSNEPFGNSVSFMESRG